MHVQATPRLDRHLPAPSSRDHLFQAIACLVVVEIVLDLNCCLAEFAAREVLALNFREIFAVLAQSSVPVGGGQVDHTIQKASEQVHGSAKEEPGERVTKRECV
jgi:hypothetical protein